ncbi:MAG: hypothetical protein ACLGGV_03560 [Bacteroidia bacterium]
MNKYLHIITSIFLLLGVASTALSQQGVDPNLGKYYYNKGNYPEAIKILSQARKTSPNDVVVNTYLGLSFLHSEIEPKKALDYLRLAYDSSKNKGDLPYYLGKALMHHLKYDEAIIYFNEYKKPKFKEQVCLEIKKCELAAELVKNKKDVKIVNLGSTVNTGFPDYYPYFYEADSTLFFTSRRSKKGTAIEFDGLYQADIFSCKLVGEEVQNLQEVKKLNTTLDDQMAGLGKNKEAYVYIDHIETYGDILKFTIREDFNYRQIKEFVLFTDPKEIFTTVYFNANETKMFYTSNGKQNKKDFDIFYCEKISATEWSLPVNININTPFDEGFPFLSPDEKTLYFCSNGLPGMGGFDLYKSVWNEEAKLWGTPENLGYPINTPSDEKFIWFTSNMKTAFISGYREEGFGFSDIYKVIFK